MATPDDDEPIRAAIERGLADLDGGHTHTTDEVSDIVRRVRAALSSRGEGFSREESIKRARAAVDAIRLRKC